MKETVEILCTVYAVFQGGVWTPIDTEYNR